MSIKKYSVVLSSSERQELLRWSKSQRRSERERKRARILLLADQAQEGGAAKDSEIAAQVKVALLTVNRVRQRFEERGLESSVHRKVQEKRKPRRLDGQGEAFLVALTCGTPPHGQQRWTLRLLKEALIEQEIIDDIGQETIRQTLKKMHLNLG